MGGKSLISLDDCKRAEDIGKCKNWDFQFSSTDVFSFSTPPFSHCFSYNRLSVWSFSKAPHWLVDKIPSTQLDVQSSLQSGLQSFTKQHLLYSFIGYHNPLSDFSLPHSSSLLTPSPIPVWTHFLLFKLQLLCQLSHEAFLDHASRVVTFYLINSCLIFYPVAFKFLAGITVRNTFCIGTLLIETRTHTHP